MSAMFSVCVPQTKLSMQLLFGFPSRCLATISDGGGPLNVRKINR